MNKSALMTVVLALCSLGLAQAPDDKKAATIASVLDGTVKQIEGRTGAGGRGDA